MLEYVREALQIYRQKGAYQLGKEIAQFCRNLPSELWYVNRGYQSVSIGGTTAKIAVTDRAAVREIQFARENESELIKEIFGELRSGDVLLDVGSHIGIVAALVAEKQPDCQVIAIEPYPPNITALRQTADYSHGGTIDIIERPLSDSVEKIGMSVPDLPGTRGVASTVKSVGSRTIQVESTTGDLLVESGQISQPNIVKIDVEGAEVAVLNGARSLLESPECRMVICEVHEIDNDLDSDSNREQVESMLSAAGFETEIILDRGLEVQLLGRKPEA